jgi:hypothetical protein
VLFRSAGNVALLGSTCGVSDGGRVFVPHCAQNIALLLDSAPHFGHAAVFVCGSSVGAALATALKVFVSLSDISCLPINMRWCQIIACAKHILGRCQTQPLFTAHEDSGAVQNRLARVRARAKLHSRRT